MKKITELTRRDIFSLLQNGIEGTSFLEPDSIYYDYYGIIGEITFLNRLYDLKTMPSLDSRYYNAEDEIRQHTINNDDYENGWVFKDERFGLLNGEDEILLKFLCEVFHPIVRDEKGYWKEFLDKINALLRIDGYDLYPESKISGRDVYGWRKYNPEDYAFSLPFSKRHEKEIKSKQLKLILHKNTRYEIYKLLERYTENFSETDDTGWNYRITTSECVFREISSFYIPKCYVNGEYVETSDMKQFIMNTSPFSVFDVIELYEDYNKENNYTLQINKLLISNSVTYRLENGKLESILNIDISKNDISSITERGLKELIFEAEGYYKKGNKQIAVEKLWDAFERMKTYYSPTLKKPDSANKIINDMSSSIPKLKALYEEEFKVLTNIGNDFRIRHHEKTKIDITDERQYDYFYKRCLSLISVAILYLEGGANK